MTNRALEGQGIQVQPIINPNPVLWFGLWGVAGHCSKCGAPIFAKADFSAEEKPPRVAGSCRCMLAHVRETIPEKDETSVHKAD